MTGTLFRDIIRQSWQIMWRHKYLWLFGFFAALMGNGGEMQVLLNNIINVGESPATLLSLRNLYGSGLLGVIFINFVDFLHRSPLEALLFLLVFIATGIVVIWLIVTSQGALYDGINRIVTNKKADMAQGYRAGSHYFGRVLSLTILSAVCTYGVLFILSLPIIVILLIKSSQTGVLLYLLFGFLILVPLGLIIAMVAKYAVLYVVTYDQKLWQSINSGWRLLKRNLLISIETSIVVFILGLVGAFALVIALIFLSVPFILLGFLTLVFNTSAGFMFIIILGLVVLGITVGVYGAMFSAFRYSVWTLLFLRLIENKGESKILRMVGQAAQYFGKKPA